MTGAPEHHDATDRTRTNAQEPVQYPANHLLAVLDTQEQVNAAVAALTAGGFLESEIHPATGVERADALGSATGHRGFVGMVIRLAERLGVADEEMETKNRYEQVMRDNRFVVAVAAPTEERKDRAAEILREHGGHTMAFFGKHTIEYLIPPNVK
jgi:hypothetical protein